MAANVAVSLSRKVKIGMVCHVNDSILIAFGFIFNFQLIILRENVGHTHLFIAGESHISVLVRKGEGYSVLLFQHVPDSLVISQFLMAVKVVFSVVFVKLTELPVHRKRRASYAVGVRTDSRAEKSVIVKIGLQRIVAQNHIVRLSVLIGHKQIHKNRPVINHAGFHTL